MSFVKIKNCLSTRYNLSTIILWSSTIVTLIIIFKFSESNRIARFIQRPFLLCQFH